MKNNVLEALVNSGTIKSYQYQIVYRNTQRLTIVFNDDNVIVLDTFCSECLENTSIIVSNG